MCDICNGSKFIKLPLKKSLDFSYKSRNVVEENIENSFKTFPCPQCTKTVPKDNVRIYKFRQSFVDTFYADETGNILNEITKNSIRAIAEKIYEDGFFDIKDYREKSPFDKILRDVRVAIVDNKTVEEIEQERDEKTLEIISEAIKYFSKSLNFNFVFALLDEIIEFRDDIKESELYHIKKRMENYISLDLNNGKNKFNKKGFLKHFKEKKIRKKENDF